MYNSVKAKAKQVKANEVSKDEFKRIIEIYLKELEEEIKDDTKLNINIKVNYAENVNKY